MVATDYSTSSTLTLLRLYSGREGSGHCSQFFFARLDTAQDIQLAVVAKSFVENRQIAPRRIVGEIACCIVWRGRTFCDQAARQICNFFDPGIVAELQCERQKRQEIPAGWVVEQLHYDFLLMENNAYF